MNEYHSFERFLADQFATAELERPPSPATDQVITAARRMRPLPRWLALLKEPPMRTSSRVAVGSPAARITALLIVLMAFSVVTAGGMAVGASLLASPVPGQACPSGPGTFESGPPFVSPRGGVVTAQLSDGRLLVVGGGPADAELYDPAADAFRPAGTPASTDWLRAVPLADDRVLLLPGRAIRPTEVWDPRTETFSPSGSPLNERGDYLALALPDGRVLVIGGNHERNGQIEGPILDAEVWDPTTGAFTVEPALAGLAPDTATLLDDGRVLLVGDLARAWGDQHTGESPEPSAAVWNPSSGALEATDAPSAWRVGSAAARLSDGRVLVVGGNDWDEESVPDAELYDPTTDAFTPAGSLTAGRFLSTATLLLNGRVLVVGGLGRGDVGTKEAEVWDPISLAFTADATMARRRIEHLAAALPDCGVLVLGGLESPSQDTERWVPGA
jgi:hypothetical protein